MKSRRKTCLGLVIFSLMALTTLSAPVLAEKSIRPMRLTTEGAEYGTMRRV